MAAGKWHNALVHAGRARELAGLMVGDPRYCDREWLGRRAGSDALLRLINGRLAMSSPDRAGPVVH
jgi:hypothetical protein